MKTYFKLLGIITLVLLTFGAGMLLERELTKWDEVGKPTYNMRNLYFDKQKTRLFLKTKTWGYTGDHSLTVLSLNSDKEFQPNAKQEYIFDGDELFYKQTTDSLIIYYDSLISKPNLFSTSVKVKLVKYKDYQALNDVLKNSLQKYE